MSTAAIVVHMAIRDTRLLAPRRTQFLLATHPRPLRVHFSQKNSDQQHHLKKGKPMIPVKRCSLTSACLAAALFVSAAISASPQTPALLSPATLPGQGLAQHDFFYAGEAQQERMFIVRGGQITWSYTHDGKGEISDAVMLP